MLARPRQTTTTARASRAALRHAVRRLQPWCSERAEAGTPRSPQHTDLSSAARQPPRAGSATHSAVSPRAADGWIVRMMRKPSGARGRPTPRYCFCRTSHCWFATNALVCAGQRRRLLSPRSGRVHGRRETTPSSPEQPRLKGLGPAISPPLSDKEPLARFCVVGADSRARPARVPHARRRRPATLAVVR